MKYISTRNKNIIGFSSAEATPSMEAALSAESVPSAEAIKKGLADDGGLFFPEKIPQIDGEFINKLVNLNYSERAEKILSLYLDDYSVEELKEACKSAYSKEKFGENPANVQKLEDGKYILELWHGPTCAFKDMALQIMPRLLSRALVKTGEKKDALILVATSGDTGKAALEGYKDVHQTKITVFFPSDGVSEIQKLQMTTQEGGNVDVCAVEGNFDDCQTGVKKIFSDSAVAEFLAEKNIFLSSANSINWGRLVPQIVYYFSAYCDMIKSNAIKSGEIINVTVPTGNFGNILAAFTAKKMGLPLGNLVCASNSNNILTDFINTGVYDRNRKFRSTISPSMDILISSNLERLLFILSNGTQTSQYMKELNENGKYEIDSNIKAAINNHFSAYYCDEENTKSTINNIFRKYNYLSDPHTAVALYCGEKYTAEINDGRKMLFVSTASPYKFAEDVYKSVENIEIDKSQDIMKLLSELTQTEIPLPLENLKNKTPRFTKTLNPDEMKNYVSATDE